jgi:hypothetical protein
MIPPGTVTMTLTGYRLITTEEGTGDWDYMGIQLWDDAVTATGLVGTFVQFSNLNASPGWLSFMGTVSVGSRAGQSVDFDMWSEHDYSNVTDFNIDSLTLTAFVCP